MRRGSVEYAGERFARLIEAASRDLPNPVFVQDLRSRLAETFQAQSTGAQLRASGPNGRSASAVGASKQSRVFGQGRTRRSFASFGAVLLTITIVTGLVFTAASRKSESERAASSAATVGYPESEGTALDAPGGGYQETQFASMVFNPLLFGVDLTDGDAATLDSLTIEPGAATRLDESVYGTAGIAVAFVLQGALVVTFESDVFVNRRGPADVSVPLNLIEAGEPVELVTGDAVAYEIGHGVTIRNPFSTLQAQLLRVVVSDDAIPVVQPADADVVAVTRQDQQETELRLSTFNAGVSVHLDSYWNLALDLPPVEAGRIALHASATTDSATKDTRGWVISISEPNG
jgi:hypothetical protein